LKDLGSIKSIGPLIVNHRNGARSGRPAGGNPPRTAETRSPDRRREKTTHAFELWRVLIRGELVGLRAEFGQALMPVASVLSETHDTDVYTTL